MIVLAICIKALVSAIREVRAFHRAMSSLSERAVASNLATLIERGRADAWFIFSDRKGGRFVQFRKRISDTGRESLESIFPRSTWSETYYFRVLGLLQELTVPSTRVALDEPDAPVEYIQSDFGVDLQSAARFVVRTFHEIFEFGGPSLHLEGEGIGARSPNRDRPVAR